MSMSWKDYRLLATTLNKGLRELTCTVTFVHEVAATLHINPNFHKGRFLNACFLGTTKGED